MIILSPEGKAQISTARVAALPRFANLRGKVVGLLDIQTERVNAFKEDDQLIFEAVADNIAGAIHNSDLYQTEQWRRRVGDSLREVAGLLSDNVGLDQSLQAILAGLALVHERFGKAIVYPMHPRTQSKIKGLSVSKGIRVIDPLGFYDFNCLSMHAFCLMGDSGTTPEEGLFYRVPCVSLRKTTERPETVEAGAHIVAGLDPRNIVDAVETIVGMPWTARYDFFEDFSPSSVVINVLRSQITNYF